MERFSKTHFRNVGYKTLIQEGWTHEQIATADVNSIKIEMLLEPTGRLRNIGLRTDSHWLENVGRHTLGFEMIDSDCWYVDMRGMDLEGPNIK